MKKEFFIHPLADVHSKAIGDGTRIWQYSVVLSGATSGRDSNLCAHTFEDSGVPVGDRVTVKSGVYLWEGLTIEDDVFLGPNVTFTNDRFPRSRVAGNLAETRICKGASVSAGAILLPGVAIGEAAIIGAGAVVTKSVPAGETWVGNPARRLNMLTA